MGATLFGDNELQEVEANLAGLGFHSLHPDIVHLYYGHLYKQRWNIEYCLAVSPIRGKTYIFTDAGIPDQLCKAGFKIHSPKPLTKANKYTEVVYDLAKLSDRDQYGSKKSYYNAVKAPQKWVDNNDVSLTLASEIPNLTEHLALYEKWVKQKVARGVHLITFPVARYRRCIKLANEMDNLKILEMRRNSNNELIAFRIVLIDKELAGAYDIVFVSDLEITQLSNAFNFVGLELIKACSITTFNCGVSSGKLKTYKKQYPNYEKTVYLIGGENAS